MNPFTLPGPQFLLFYLLFAIATLLLLYLWRHSHESGRLPNLALKDPYLFACLSGGAAEVIRVAVFNLVDRGLLQLSGSTFTTAPGFAPDAGRTRVEKDVLRFFKYPETLAAVLRQTSVRASAINDYENVLRTFRLIPHAQAWRRRHLGIGVAVLALLGVGGTKIAIALSVGRTNVWILVVMMIAAVIVAVMISYPYRTSLGSAYLASLRSLFSDLRARAGSIRPGGGSRDLLWLTALFGIDALPAAAFPFAQLFQRKSASSGCGSGGCGSGGGSGCGGGGGGCGGCGS